MLRLLQPRPLVNPTKKVGITLSVGFISLLTEAMPKPPKPDQSEMTISFKIGRSGSGTTTTQKLLLLLSKKQTSFFSCHQILPNQSALGFFSLNSPHQKIDYPCRTLNSLSKKDQQILAILWLAGCCPSERNVWLGLFLLSIIWALLQ